MHHQPRTARRSRLCRSRLHGRQWPATESQGLIQARDYGQRNRGPPYGPQPGLPGHRSSAWSAGSARVRRALTMPRISARPTPLSTPAPNIGAEAPGTGCYTPPPAARQRTTSAQTRAACQLVRRAGQRGPRRGLCQAVPASWSPADLGQARRGRTGRSRNRRGRNYSHCQGRSHTNGRSAAPADYLSGHPTGFSQTDPRQSSPVSRRNWQNGVPWSIRSAHSCLARRFRY